MNRTATSEYTEFTDNWCLSGGAEGADLAWGTAARESGHKVTHFSFHDHRTNAPQDEVYRLSQNQLEAATPQCLKANLSLRRRFPPDREFVKKLLQRDWYQTESANSLYAVSHFDTRNKNVVAGGTGWAVQMFLDRHARKTCSAYVFDQTICRWYHWIGVWQPIYEPPRPLGVWAGIGAQNLNLVGRLAINVLLDYWPREKTIWSS